MIKMSDYVPSTAMDNFESIGNALDEKIRKIESDLVQNADGSWTSRSASTSPRDSPPGSTILHPGLSLIEDPNSKELPKPQGTPPWERIDDDYYVPPKQSTLPPPPLHQAAVVRQSATVAPLPVQRATTKTPETEFREAVKKRSRTQFSSNQLVALERAFANNIYITRASRGVLARELCLSEKQIKIWFQNRRMKENKVLKGTQAHKANRLAATAVKNLKRLEEKQKDQSIVSRLMSQRQAVIGQATSYAANGNFLSGDDVHQVRAVQQYHQYPPAPPPYPAGSQLYQEQRSYYQPDVQYQPNGAGVYRSEMEKPQFDIPMPYNYADHTLDQLHDHLMDYPIVSGMLINDMPSSTIAWGNILDRQLTA
uniref:Homeobox domain-containing protein n=2 Tax=Lutzomyia longipalpis TaxID=7200 RepID=A0A1B0CQL0_LUTLO